MSGYDKNNLIAKETDTYKKSVFLENKTIYKANTIFYDSKQNQKILMDIPLLVADKTVKAFQNNQKQQCVYYVMFFTHYCIKIVFDFISNKPL